MAHIDTLIIIVVDVVVVAAIIIIIIAIITIVIVDFSSIKRIRVPLWYLLPTNLQIEIQGGILKVKGKKLLTPLWPLSVFFVRAKS